MKKTLLTTFFYPPEKGGIQNYLYELFNRLPNDKVFTLAKSQKGDSDFDQKQNYKTYRTSFDSKLKYFKLSNLTFYRQIKKIVKEEKIEMLALGHPLPLGISAIWLKDRLNIPYIVFTHGKEIFEIINPSPQSPQPPKVKTQNFASQKQNLASLKYHALQKTLSNAHRIITTTDFMKQSLIKEFGLNKDKFAIVPPGITPPVRVRLIAPLRATSTENETKSVNPSLLTVARLVKRKGHHLVIKTIKNLIEDFPDLKYTIVGKGEEKENLKKLTKELNLEDHVIFKENVSDEDLEKIYQNSDIFIMPSLEINGDLEGFGLVFLEASSYGLPIIATKSGGIPEAVIDSKTGILLSALTTVKPQNLAARPKQNLAARPKQNLAALIPALESTIKDLLQNPNKRQKLAQNGQKRALTQFDWQTQANKLKNVLRSS